MGMNIHNILSFSPDLSCFLELARFGLVDRMEFNPFLYLFPNRVHWLSALAGKSSPSALASACSGGVTVSWVTARILEESFEFLLNSPFPF